MTIKKSIGFLLVLGVFAAGAAHAADVKENWEKNCVKCHGADGSGKTKMGEKLKIKDYSDAKNQAELKDDAMAKAIKEGVKQGDSTRMKAFGDVLSDDEIKELVKFFRTLKK